MKSRKPLLRERLANRWTAPPARQVEHQKLESHGVEVPLRLSWWPTLFCVAVWGGLAWFAMSAGQGIAEEKSSPTDSKQSAEGAAEALSFNEVIRPILSDNCFYCHGPDEGRREADLRLDDREAALAAFAIVPGKPEESELIARLEETDPDIKMPPPHANREVTPAQIELLKRWIAAGADYQEHWAFKPLEPVEVPESPEKTAASASDTHPIDAFVERRLRTQGLQLSPPASPETLIRRITFDLTGLPPTLEEIEEFVADDAPDSVEKLIDRLFAREQYGERMASEWLDVARYSDSYGYQVDRDRFVWPWRDWVVRAFNRNLPYDQFIIEQLAGDLLPNATDEQILATTFNRLHPHNIEGGSVEEEFRIESIADRTQTYGTAFLGLTLECARCHSHKYDPISQAEYYQLSAYFDNIDEAGLISFFTDAIPTPTLLLATDEQKQAIAEIEQEIAERERQWQRLKTRKNAAFEEWLRTARSAELARQLVKLDQQKDSESSSDSKNEATAQNSAKSSTQQEPATAQQSAGKAKSSEQATLPQLPRVPHPWIPGRIADLNFEELAVGNNQLVPGRVGQAVRLTGDDAIPLEVGNFRRYEPFSVALWLNTPEHKERAVIFHRSRAWTDAASRGYELLLEEGRLSAALIHFWPGNALRVQARAPLPVNEWVHVGITYDGSSRAAGLRIFVNGSPIETEVVRDQLTKNITGGGGDNIAIGERFRDRGFKNGLVDEFQVYQRELTPLEVAQLHDDGLLPKTLEKPFLELTGQDRQLLRDWYHALLDEEAIALREELLKLRQRRSELVDPIQEIMVMRETPQPVTSHLLLRGDYGAKGPEVLPQTLSRLHPFPEETPPNRLGLARWTTDPRNPLTARVTVNRYWQMLFGEGLVRTPEDFGSQGESPTHPELLDWLAWDFLEHGWDVRHLLKQILLSKTYQQSSVVTRELVQKDPENRLLSRYPRRRLPAEMLRDATLAQSGLLVHKVGGPYVKPYEVEASFKPSPRGKGENLYRRSLYTYWKRNAPAPVMLALDASIRDVCRVKREKTMSPLQAFVLLNGPQFVEASRVLAEELLKQHGQTQDSTLVDLFRRLTSRPPEADELAVLRELHAEQLQLFEESPALAGELLSVGDRTADSNLPPASVAALAIVVNTLFNFDDVQMQR